MKTTTRHVVEISVPIPVGVGVRMGERRMHVSAESGHSADQAIGQIRQLAKNIVDAIQVEQAEQA